MTTRRIAGLGSVALSHAQTKLSFHGRHARILIHTQTQTEEQETSTLSSKITKLFTHSRKQKQANNRTKKNAKSPPDKPKSRLPAARKCSSAHDSTPAKIAREVSALHWEQLPSLVASSNPAFHSCHVPEVLLNLKKRPRLALQFLVWVQKNLGFKPDLQSLCIVSHLLTKARMPGSAQKHMLRALREQENPASSSGSNPASAKMVFDGLVSTFNDCESTPLVFDLLIRACAESGMVESAAECFGFMEIYGFVPKIETCNMLLNGLLAAQDFEALWVVYAEMLRCKIVSNVETFNIMMQTLCKQGKSSKARDFLEDMYDMGFRPNAVSYTILIGNFAARGQTEDVLQLFDEMRERGLSPDVYCYFAAISGLCRHGQDDEAMKLFKQMIESDLQPNALICNELILGLCDKGKLQEALKIRDMMSDKKLSIGLCTYNPLLYGCFAQGKVEEAEAMFGEMIDRGVVPDAVTSCVFIHGYCKQRKLAEALTVFSQMLREGFQPSAVTFISLIHELLLQANHNQAEFLFQEMAENDLNTDAKAYNTMIFGYCYQGKMGRAVELLDEMEAKLVSATADSDQLRLSYKMLIRGFCQTGKAEEAQKLVDRMRAKGLEPDHETYNAVIVGYVNRSNFEEVSEFHDVTSGKQIGANAFNYTAILEYQCKETDAESTNKLLERMISKGLLDS